MQMHRESALTSKIGGCGEKDLEDIKHYNGHKGYDLSATGATMTIYADLNESTNQTYLIFASPGPGSE